MEEQIESPEEVLVEQEEHQGDLITLEDVKFRLDGVLFCEAEGFEEVIAHMEQSGRSLRIEQEEQIAVLRRLQSDEIPVTMSRYVILDIDYDPSSGDITQKAVADALAKVNETLDDPKESWWYNDSQDGWELGEILHSMVIQLKPIRFAASSFQVYNYSDLYRQAGLEEMGDCV